MVHRTFPWGRVRSPCSFNWRKTAQTCTIKAPKDTSKPFGDACTPNGGLKDADEIKWVNDPDDDCDMMNCKSAGNKRSSWVLTLIRQEFPTSTA
jgi:hypothetical protein